MDWDPIGVRGFNGPTDEYWSYVPQVFKLALEDAVPLTIAEYLHNIVKERMGLKSRIDQHFAVAEKIRILKLNLMPEQ